MLTVSPTIETAAPGSGSPVCASTTTPSTRPVAVAAAAWPEGAAGEAGAVCAAAAPSVTTEETRLSASVDDAHDLNDRTERYSSKAVHAPPATLS